MFNQKMLDLGQKSSVIRELFEYGKARKALVGEDKVYDFSIGNPSVAPPKELKERICDLLENTNPVLLHGYTSAAGDMNVRTKIAEYLTQNSGCNYSADKIYMTCGAAASLTVSLKAIINEGDEVILLAPFFPEYRVFTENAGGKCLVCHCVESDFSIDFDVLNTLINENTKAVIVNSPNNPSGVVYNKDCIIKLASTLNAANQKYGNDIYLICDEPYRELIYDDCIEVPYVQAFYNNTILCYSFSKSLSLPGERIGYIAISENCDNKDELFAAVCGAGRSMGYVCAPSLFQYVVADFLGKTSDISVYKTNRDILCKMLREIGYTVVEPNGAFYLFLKALECDAGAFSEKAKKYDLLLVPGDGFSMPGYVRISYCVSEKTIINSKQAFIDLYNEYKG